MNESLGPDLTLKLTAAPNRSTEARNSREDGWFSKLKDLATAGVGEGEGLWFFQEWDGLTWISKNK